MKRKLLLVLSALLLLSGCGSPENEAAADASDEAQQQETLSPEVQAIQDQYKAEQDAVDAQKSGDVIEIKEKLFISQVNDVYINTEDYLGKTIRLEGLFKAYYYESTDMTYYYVLRYGPGCCGDDGDVGFEIAWDDGYPEEDDWIEAEGVLEQYEENGYQYLRLRLHTLNVMDERGQETVS